MKIISTPIDGLIVFEPKIFQDNRGYFFESWQKQRYQENGIPYEFVQDNVSRSTKDTLRGLHAQNPNPQGKLVVVLSGSVFDVAVDLRYNSPTFGKWFGTELSSENHRQMYIPPGFAHGFLVLSSEALFLYKCTDYYAGAHEITIQWNDPDIGIDWPLNGNEPLVSEKDRRGARFSDIPTEKLLPFL